MIIAHPVESENIFQNVALSGPYQPLRTIFFIFQNRNALAGIKMNLTDHLIDEQWVQQDRQL